MAKSMQVFIPTKLHQAILLISTPSHWQKELISVITCCTTAHGFPSLLASEATLFLPEIVLAEVITVFNDLDSVMSGPVCIHGF